MAAGGPCIGTVMGIMQAATHWTCAMHDLPTLLLFLAAATVIALSPGPGMLYVASRTLAGGRGEGMASTLGTGIGGFVHVLGGALGVSVLLATSATAFTVLKLVGGVYLIWLGIRTFRGAALAVPEASATGSNRALREGIVVEATNPKTAAFFLAVLRSSLTPMRRPWRCSSWRCSSWCSMRSRSG